MEHRSIDVVWAVLPMSVACAILWVFFEETVKKLKKQHHYIVLIGLMAFCVLIALALVNSRLVNLAIPIPVPSVRVPTSPRDASVVNVNVVYPSVLDCPPAYSIGDGTR